MLFRVLLSLSYLIRSEIDSEFNDVYMHSLVFPISCFVSSNLLSPAIAPITVYGANVLCYWIYWDLTKKKPTGVNFFIPTSNRPRGYPVDACVFCFDGTNSSVRVAGALYFRSAAEAAGPLTRCKRGRPAFRMASAGSLMNETGNS